jgi:hypothetical protein
MSDPCSHSSELLDVLRHDETGQTLTTAKLNLKMIAPDAPRAVPGRLDDNIQLLDRLP